jgi:hypothetical protein
MEGEKSELSMTEDIMDLTSDKIDFLEINSDELIDLSHDVIDVFQMESTENKTT